LTLPLPEQLGRFVHADLHLARDLFRDLAAIEARELKNLIQVLALQDAGAGDLPQNERKALGFFVRQDNALKIFRKAWAFSLSNWVRSASIACFAFFQADPQGLDQRARLFDLLVVAGDARKVPLPRLGVAGGLDKSPADVVHLLRQVAERDRAQADRLGRGQPP
jgi:hypothetical protein